MTDHSVTHSELKLYDALVKRGVKVVLHHNDGHKTVDLAVLEASIYIEVDDLTHFTNPDRILSDFKRSHYSDGDDFNTFYVTNQILDNYTEEVADALADVVETRLDNKNITSLVN